MQNIVFVFFPDFNMYSTPLLVLALQGLVFVGLLLYRFFSKRNISDFFLALILLIVCYEQICFTVGFMGWYNEFKNTKINYFLIPMSLALAPSIYFYVKSITTSNFKFNKKQLLHYVPILLLIIFKFSIYFYDSLQLGFKETQNGTLKLSLDEAVVQPILMLFSYAQMLLYLAFTFQLFFNYRKTIKEYFSNTYKLELNWILTFLVLFTSLFLYSSTQDIIGNFIVKLNYQQRWWLNIFGAIVVIYVGIKGYFTNTTKLNNLSFDLSSANITTTISRNNSILISDDEVKTLQNLMENDKLFLNPELNLKDLAEKAKMNRTQVSQIINSSFSKNFNDFVNEYRVNAFKEKLNKGEHKQLSLLGLAMDCGFNSKATFNRVFKKITKTSPSEYLASQAK